MEQVNLFELAAREAYRFPSSKGNIALEDLYKLPFVSANGPSLEQVAQTLHSEIKNGTEVSFTGNDSVNPRAAELNNKLELVKTVIAYKKAENLAKATAQQKAQAKQRINQLIAEKQDQQLSDKSIDELQALVASM